MKPQAPESGCNFLDGMRRFRSARLRTPACSNAAANLSAFAALLCLVVFWNPKQVSISVLYLTSNLGGSQGFPFSSLGEPESPSLQRARAAQEQFCDDMPLEQLDNPPKFLEVPWAPGQAGTGPNSTTQLVLRKGLQGHLVGSSEPFQQYLFQNNDIVSGLMLRDGGWEMGELTQILRLMQQFAKIRRLKNQDVYFIDVGANVGVFTLFLAAYGFSVIAFEPLHANVMALRHTLCANPHLLDRITLVNKALGNESRMCGIWTLDTNLGDGTLVCRSDLKLPPDLKKRQDLEIARLDDELAGALAALAGRVGAVKVDVEGFELPVIKGAQHFFDLVKPAGVMMECNDGMLTRAAGEPASALLTKMHQLGYTVHQGSFTGQVIPPAKFPSWREPNIANYYCVRRKGT